MEYSEKFEQHKNRTLYPLLESEDQQFLRQAALAHRLTFQELRQVATACRDLAMWGEPPLRAWWQEQERTLSHQGPHRKDQLLGRLHQHLAKLTRAPKRYPAGGTPPPLRRPYRIASRRSERQVFGVCPVYSEGTLCCGLRTLDAVERCPLGCSYCTIQTFYGEDVVFDADLERKLEQIELEPDRFRHVCTGQSSDSLLWGNRNRLLEILFGFARRHPRLLLELKTKSGNVSYLLEQGVPPNVVCSWSLNTQTIIDNEEHHTASLEERLQAAEQVARAGGWVAFHFHPLVYYAGWEEEYEALARTLQQRLPRDRVLFVSLGTITFIKPVLRELRRRGIRTRISQMEMAPDPKGKLTYPLEVKRALYRHLYGALRGWQDRVFLYLCMEPREVWQEGLGRCYRDSREFEAAFAQEMEQRLGRMTAAGQ